MSTIQTLDGTAYSSPLLVIGFETTRRSQSIFHEVIGGGEDVTLRPASQRSGILRLLYVDEAAGVAAEEMHARGTVLYLQDTDRPTVSMYYVFDGTMTLRLDDDTQELWTLDVGYREVTP